MQVLQRYLSHVPLHTPEDYTRTPLRVVLELMIQFVEEALYQFRCFGSVLVA